MHVGDLNGAATGSRQWTATVSIRVEDAAHAAVPGATVSGSWSNGGGGACITAGGGTCTISKTKIQPSVSSVVFTVTSVARSGWTYAPGSNHDPDEDSTGTSIVVRRL